MVFKGVYASLRGVGFADAVMPSFCFQLWHEALEPHTTDQGRRMSSNSCERVSTQSLRGVGQNEPMPMPTQPMPSAWEPAPGT